MKIRLKGDSDWDRDPPKEHWTVEVIFTGVLTNIELTVILLILQCVGLVLMAFVFAIFPNIITFGALLTIAVCLGFILRCSHGRRDYLMNNKTRIRMVE